MTSACRRSRVAFATLLFAAAPLAVAGCSSDAGDGGGADGGAKDTGRPDGGSDFADVSSEAGAGEDVSPDAPAAGDGGYDFADVSHEAGPEEDASPDVPVTDGGAYDDGGTPDTGWLDAGGDTGAPPDGGPGTDDGGEKDSGQTDAGNPEGDGGRDAGGDAGSAPPDPVLFVHGVNGSAANWDTMIGRFIADGWPADRLVAHTFDDPKLGCNVDNAATIKGWVDDILSRTGTARIDLVAHSMGSLSSRHYVKNFGGAAVVKTYVTLGGMHHGLWSPCLSPKGMQCTWDELCGTREFLTQLNQPPVTPGPAIWVSMYGTADSDVPNSSSQLDGAENIAFEGVEHDGANGLQEVEAVYLEVRRVLEY